jgi:hypothetical protein
MIDIDTWVDKQRCPATPGARGDHVRARERGRPVSNPYLPTSSRL